eukprot:1473752-Pyramimonas_sp.AAC.1
MPELALLPELCRNNYSYSVNFSRDGDIFLDVELQMSYRAVRHSNRKRMIRSASPKFLDAPTRSAARAGSDKLC